MKKLRRSPSALWVETRPDYYRGYGLHELRASQVETIWFFVGSLLHYLIFGILFVFLVEKVDSLASFAS